jgi:hypothetical protein
MTEKTTDRFWDDSGKPVRQTWCPDAARYDRGKCGWPQCGCPDNGPTDADVKSQTTELHRAVIMLNRAIDDYWNDHVRGLGLTGMGEHHMLRITNAQRRCREALEAEGVEGLTNAE